MRGSISRRIFVRHEIVYVSQSLLLFRAGHFTSQHVVMRDNPTQNRNVFRVPRRVEAQRQQKIRVFEQRRRPTRIEHVALLVRLFARHRVRELLTDVTDRKKNPGVFRARDVPIRDESFAHPRDAD